MAARGGTAEKAGHRVRRPSAELVAKAAQGFAHAHPTALAVLAGAAACALAALLVWYLVFSGLAGASGFIYQEF